jgi:hypothetical protein
MLAAIYASKSTDRTRPRRIARLSAAMSDETTVELITKIDATGRQQLRSR